MDLCINTIQRGPCCTQWTQIKTRALSHDNFTSSAMRLYLGVQARPCGRDILLTKRMDSIVGQWDYWRARNQRRRLAGSQSGNVKGPFTPSASTSVDARRATDVNARRRTWRAWCEWAFNKLVGYLLRAYRFSATEVIIIYYKIVHEVQHHTNITYQDVQIKSIA